MLAAAEVPWDIVCFHAQQIAEKLLKGYLVSRGIVPKKTHDLTLLLSECGRAGAGFGDLIDDCELLLRFGASSRYPGLGFEPGEEDGRAAVAAARRVRERVLSAMPPA
jgi:HEPN domain-containing protein